MASYEEMQEMHPTAPTPAVMESEMKACEIEAAEEILEACIDEVFVRPDVNRTTFVWQIESTVTDTDAEDEWEKEDSSWRCLPQHWQEILNSRLAKHHSAIQDAKAFYEHRLEEFGAEDVKTKNAQKKMTDLQSGKNSCSIVLIMKGTGKEGGQDLYKRCVQNLKGELKVSVSSKVLAHKVCMETLKLVTLEDPPSREIASDSFCHRQKQRNPGGAIAPKPSFLAVQQRVGRHGFAFFREGWGQGG